jgi:hypothetical protein
MAILSLVITVLNFYAKHGFHTIEKYLVFKERILHGFALNDVVPSYPTPPTFPMWGYGWVLLLTTNKALLITIQTVVALLSASYFFKTIKRLQLLNNWSITFLHLFILFCTPWYAYNSIDWCQSLATSFLIFSLSLFLIATQKTSKWLFALSAICFGLNLNLASDMYVLPIGVAVCYCLYEGFSRRAVAQSMRWLAGIAVMLLPWMIYTWHATGRPLVKSTNEGHVLFIGLGQDPQNRFGITYSDQDPRMYKVLREQLGDDFAKHFYASVSYAADGVLQKAFLKIVADQTAAYADLVKYKLTLILTGRIGTYNGEFDEPENVGRFNVPIGPRKYLHIYTLFAGCALQLGTTLFAPFAVWSAIRHRKLAWAIILLPIAYQYLTCALAVTQPQYLANLILLQLLLCSNGMGIVVSRLCAYRDVNPLTTHRQA